MAVSQQLERRLNMLKAMSELLESLVELERQANEAFEAEQLEKYQAEQAELQPPQEEMKVLPAAIQLQPLQNIDPGVQVNQDPVAVERERAEATLERERAERAMAASRKEAARAAAAVAANTPAPASAPAPSLQLPKKPTAEERQARAEHLKKQRDMLVQKKNAERQDQLNTFTAASGPSAAARIAEQACASSLRTSGPPVNGTGRLLAEELSGKAPAPPPAVVPDVEAAAVQMRRTLTAQLKQSLIESMSSKQA